MKYYITKLYVDFWYEIKENKAAMCPVSSWHHDRWGTSPYYFYLFWLKNSWSVKTLLILSSYAGWMWCMLIALTVGGRARFLGKFFEAGIIEVTGLVSRNIVLIFTPRCISFCSKKVHLVLKQTYYVILLGWSKLNLNQLAESLNFWL